MSNYKKDPDAILDFAFDWNNKWYKQYQDDIDN